MSVFIGRGKFSKRPDVLLVMNMGPAYDTMFSGDALQHPLVSFDMSPIEEAYGEAVTEEGAFSRAHIEEILGTERPDVVIVGQGHEASVRDLRKSGYEGAIVYVGSRRPNGASFFVPSEEIVQGTLRNTLLDRLQRFKTH
jgi:hypothetical protein